jgi:hypothetical protein
MSTRSGIGFPLSDTGFEIKYVHSDGYPRGMSKTIFDHYRKGWTEERFRQFLFVDHHASFSSLSASDWSKKCGFRDIRKHDLDWKNEAAVQEYYSFPACYCHGDRQENADRSEQPIMKYRWTGPDTPHTFELYDGDNIGGMEYVNLITKTGLMTHAVVSERWNTPEDELPKIVLTKGVMTHWDDDAGLTSEYWDMVDATLSRYYETQAPSGVVIS